MYGVRVAFSGGKFVSNFMKSGQFIQNLKQQTRTYCDLKHVFVIQIGK
jgi:hypothetical protein